MKMKRMKMSGVSWSPGPCLCLGMLGLMGDVCDAAQAVSIEQARTDGAAAGMVEDSADSSFPVAAEFAAGAESRYVSEGRDNLDGDGLLTATVELGYEGVTLGVWYAYSPPADYDELDSWLQYTHVFGDFEVSAAYTNLQFLSDGTYDNELGLGVEYGALPWNLSASALGYYSFDADGMFFELGLSGEYEIQPWLTAGPYLLFGMNSGYISDGHDGANNVEIGLEGEIPLGDSFSIVGHISYNFAIDSDPGRYAGDESLNDFFHGGIALVYSF